MTNLYDISDKGHQAWNVNNAQPGYVDFCYGRYKVQTIDNASPNSGQPGATTTVNYHATVVDTPAWAQQAEVQTAFPADPDPDGRAAGRDRYAERYERRLVGDAGSAGEVAGNREPQ